MDFIVENLRLKELALVAAQNRNAFDDFQKFLASKGYGSLKAFVDEEDGAKAEALLLEYLTADFPANVAVYDGIARPYTSKKGKWLLLGWIFRDAPEQRLRPMIKSMPGTTPAARQAALLDRVRQHVSKVLPEPERWEWVAISEVVIDRLEGSRRAIKGTLFEAIVREILIELFKTAKMNLRVSAHEIRLHDETYDVSVVGDSGEILLPVKTRETMGGGHALLFTRDIHKSITAAHEAGFECIPIVIAESWTGDFERLPCRDHVYLNMNPNQLETVKPALENELRCLLDSFKPIM